MKSIVISGYFGFGNTGDEAVLAGMLESFRRIGLDARVTVLSGKPARTRAEHGVSAVGRTSPFGVLKAIRNADLVISGGGSLIQDITSAKSPLYYLGILRLAHMLKRRTMIYAQGVGPLRSASLRNSTANVFNQCDAITVRDADSKALLERIGTTKPITQVADPAYLVPPDFDAADALLAEHDLKPGEFIFVSLRPWRGEWLPQASKGIAIASEKLGISFVGIPMYKLQDLPVYNFLRCKTISDPDGVRAIKGLVARCGMVVGMRLHSLIFAAAEAKPFVSLSYDPKVESFASTAGASAQHDIQSLSADQLANDIIAAWNEREQSQSDRKSRSEEVSDSVLEAARIAADLLSHS